MPFSICFVCVFSHCFSKFFDWFCVIFWLRSHLFHPDPAKSQETLKLVADWALLSAAECCWVLLGNPIPILFPFFLSVFFFCFVQSSLFLQFVWWILCFFLASFSPFQPWPCKKSGNLEIGCRLSTAECCWVLRSVLLSAAEKSNSKPFSICFVCFWWILRFFLASFSPFSPLTLQKVRKPWNWLQIEHCWVLLSAAECCWMLLGNPIPSLFPFVLCVFSHCFVQISLFFQFFDGFCVFFWLRSQLFHPWPCKKSGNLEIGCRLSTAECCWVLLGNPIPSLFPLFCFVCIFPLFCPDFIVFSKLFEWILHFFWLRSHLFHPWPWKKSGNLEIGCRLSTAECCWVLLSAAECCGVCCWVLLRNPIPSLFPFVLCVFPLFWWILRFFLASFSPFSPLTLQKVRKPWNWLAAECCWVLLGNPIPSLFPFFLSVFFFCFVQSSLFLQFVWWILCFFLASFSPFQPWPCKKSGNLEIGCRLSTAECCWVLLSAAGKSNSHPFSLFFVCVFLLFCPEFIVSPIFWWILCFFLASFSAFSPLTLQKVRKPWNWLQIEHCWVLLSAAGKSNSHPFCICFVCVFPLFCPDIIVFPIFWWILHFFLASFSPFSSLTLQKVRKPWNWLQIEHCWVLLSAAECCWVLLSAAGKSNSQPFSICFVCVFSHCFVQISLFFPNCLNGFWLRSHLFHPWPWKKSGNLEIGCRLSTAECCWVCCCVLLRNPIPHFLPFVLCVCVPIVFVQISLFFRNFWWILWYLLGSFSALSPAKTQETSKLVVDWTLLSTAEHCWEMQSPAFFHLFCWSFHCFCHSFWWFW